MRNNISGQTKGHLEKSRWIGRNESDSLIK
jgi:hypothetical protein